VRPPATAWSSTGPRWTAAVRAAAAAAPQQQQKHKDCFQQELYVVMHQIINTVMQIVNGNK
jgi:hypothetical protein